MAQPDTTNNYGDGLRIGHVNIYHLFNKIHDLSLLLNQPSYFHVLGVSETRLNNTKSDSSVTISNYTVLRRDAETHGQTGLAAYIHNSISHLVRRRQDLESKTVECMWLEAKFSKPLIICFLYRNPSSTYMWYDEFVNMMDNAAAVKKNLFLSLVTLILIYSNHILHGNPL